MGRRPAGGCAAPPRIRENVTNSCGSVKGSALNPRRRKKTQPRPAHRHRTMCGSCDAKSSSLNPTFAEIEGQPCPLYKPSCQIHRPTKTKPRHRAVPAVRSVESHWNRIAFLRSPSSQMNAPTTSATPDMLHARWKTPYRSPERVANRDVKPVGVPPVREAQLQSPPAL
jgi:hypothetical protein